MKVFNATGLVYGNLWGGGRGSYPVRKLEWFSSKEKLLEEAEKGLDGSLDSGMGYESLIGAILLIEEIETIKVDEKEYSRTEYSEEFIGKLSEKEKEFLIDRI